MFRVPGESPESFSAAGTGVGGAGVRIGSGVGGETVAGVTSGTEAGTAAEEGDPVTRETSVESIEVVEGSDVEDGPAAGGVTSLSGVTGLAWEAN